ncbi:M28 family metallopeptidase [Marinicella litoralis]|uniref:Zn-dependent M28 family amino/carboxypeptidase n=1 Tax=Marinicella litoralis TaxID=644220 RepID=A0A4R6XYA2_9GAMM|nr:M28 family metallopeptidase [Marinicella litoralis]TDR23490.1 Zn-dependent M28 family amino/carboxypeptidase [Marinicella litoralis]
MKTLICALPFILLGCVNKQEPMTAENQTEAMGQHAISVDALTQHIKTLASDEFGGRAPGTQGEELTVEYLINEFKKAGLEPGNGDSFTQAVPLTSVEAVNQPQLTIQGGNGADLLLDYTQQQVIWTKQQIDTVSIAQSELVFVGYGINAPEHSWDDYAGADVVGKTAVMLVNDPGYATQDKDMFNGNSMTYYGRWDYKFEEAARQGAIAAIIIHDTKPAAYPWSTVASSWTGPQFDRVRADKGEQLALIEGWITKSTAEAMFDKVGLSLHQLYIAAQTRGFKAVPLDLTASATINNKVEQMTSRNVVAMIKGSESPEEVFIYMAHWDHIGTDPSLSGDNIFNGALDNATGTGGLIELAKAYTSLSEPPQRSVVFIALTAEEQGLLGSAYYAANPIFPLAQTVAGLNMDGLNYFGPTNDVTVIGFGMSQLDDYLAKNAQVQGRVLKADPFPENGYYYRSDHFELAKLGVPMLYPSIGLDHKEKGASYGKLKEDEYTAKHYHGPSDEYDSSWDLTGAVEDLRLYFLTGLEIVNSQDWPEWNQGTEFKTVRDEQRADMN